MPDMKRRRFLGVTAATVAMTAIPVLNAAARGAEQGLAIGAEFCVTDWVATDSMQDAGRIPSLTVPHHATAMRRVERDSGLRFGPYKCEAAFIPDRGAWHVMTSATVIGYA